MQRTRRGPLPQRLGTANRSFARNRLLTSEVPINSERHKSLVVFVRSPDSTHSWSVFVFYVAQPVPAASQSTVAVHCGAWWRDAAETRRRGRLRYIISGDAPTR